ncbi:MAG: lysyl-tRNA synthetase [Methanomethylovorans sp. PtaU1.Bin093]|uniref:bifunctional lysylphosphatidylglycerol flippase/synthetase MprF n=1 Tax=Methanomethylovorans sp. PtaU1.Bin093 TaxID=1811679 RepID=UPI0009D39F56|nr:bifunctional lysylphosphatidylglycerol flippase/synthetase MprF [Methanomethylovorans sp. PtaU1.Bin093]OPY18502.1 MAG: lysyl-tRNA synthetase [Methanomethylovorans sp. PtaU1.Bin093]
MFQKRTEIINNLKKISYLLPIGIFALALVTLYKQLHHMHLEEIHNVFSHISSADIFLVLVFTFLSYIILSFYDVLAVNYINHWIPIDKIVISSFISTSISYNIGFNFLTSGSLRYRLYSFYGLTLLEIGKIVTFCGLTFWVGISFIGGTVLTFYPLKLPESISIPVIYFKVVGVLLLLILFSYFFFCITQRSFKIKNHEINFPKINIAFLQLIVATLDYVLIGCVFFFLLPHYGHVSYLYVLTVFLIAQMIGLISTVPGGLGVFETIMLFMLSPYFHSNDILGTLVVFRLVYYFIPFIVGTVLLSHNEIIVRKKMLTSSHRRTISKISAFIPQIFAVLIFFAGMVLLFFEALPPQIENIRLMATIIPLSLIESSSLLSSMIGVLLLILAKGLWKRIDGAYVLSLMVLFLGAVLSILKNFNYIEALILFLTFLALLPNRNYFYRKSSLMNQLFSKDNVIAICLVIISFIWLGFFFHRHADYSHETLWQFGIDSHISRFLRSVVGSIFVLVVVGILKLLGSSSKDIRLPNEEDMDLAVKQIRTSTDTKGNLVLLKDKYLIFDEKREAFIMYSISGKSWICMGDPIGNVDNIKDLIWDFHETANLHQGWTVFYEVSEKFIPYYIDIGLKLIKIGEEAKIKLSEFNLEGSAGKDFRYSVKRMEKAGYHFEVIPCEYALDHEKELKYISDAWLEIKHTSEKKFSMGFFDIDYLSNFPLAVVKKEDKIVSFANVWLSAKNTELTIDLMRYDPAIADRTMDYLFVKLMLWGKENGYEYFSLGMSPLSGLEDRNLAPLWTKIGAAIYKHGEYFYNFKGLRAYKNKFNPIWEPRYIALPSNFKQVSALKDVALLISGGTKELLFK